MTKLMTMMMMTGWMDCDELVLYQKYLVVGDCDGRFVTVRSLD